MNKVIVKTIQNRESFINEYIEDWKSKILVNSTMYYRFDLLQINTFVVNPYILNSISFIEIELLTKKLLELFPINNNKYFNEFMNRCQFHSSNHSVETVNGISMSPKLDTEYPSLLNISDYSIFELEEYIFVFHIDLNYELGITISSIFRKEDIKLLKPFDKTIKLKKTM
ncbi:MAG: hypothetical protein Q8N78_03075 [Sulfurimonas sp.]|nr:hypothetical protein [Sulfurimonas sp.]